MIDPSSPSLIEIEKILYEGVALGGGERNHLTMSTSCTMATDKYNTKRWHILERRPEFLYHLPHQWSVYQNTALQPGCGQR